MSSEKSPSTVSQPPGPEYHHALHSTPDTPWRSLLTLTAFTGTIGTSLIAILPLSNALDRLFLGTAPNITRTLSGPNPIPLSWTPGLLLANNLIVAAQAPVSILLQRLIYNKPTGSLSSVSNRFRWSWFATLAKSMVPALAVYAGLTQIFKTAGWPKWTPRTVGMASVVLLTAPFQSAAEEFAVRGLLQRVFGSWFEDPETSFWASTALTGASFAGMHLSRDWLGNAYYVLAAVCGSLMTRWTGGLEASTLVHVGNNVAVMVPMMLADNMSFLEAMARGEGLGPVVGVPMVGLVGATWWAGREARRVGVKTREE